MPTDRPRQNGGDLESIQDPAGVELYTQTGQFTKGGVQLPVYRCARDSTSLESFHLHHFIPGKTFPLSITTWRTHTRTTGLSFSHFNHVALCCLGTSASDVHFQVYLLEGLVRWNENGEEDWEDGDEGEERGV